MSDAHNLLANLARFTRVLRQAGLPISVSQTQDLARALSWIDLGDRQQVFHTSRALLVKRREDLRLFRILFDAFFRRHGDPLRVPKPPRPRRGQPKPRPMTLIDYMARQADKTAPSLDIDDRAETWSAAERLKHRDFAALDDEELRRVRNMIQRLELRVAERVTRRRRANTRGETIDLRRALAETAKQGALPARLPRKRRTIKPRPLVLIADISGSMEKYARLVLLLFYCLSQRGPSQRSRGRSAGSPSGQRSSPGSRGSMGSVESFVFGTRLTRITAALRLRNVDRAVDEAAHSALDWSGGTRIGDAMADFNRRWARRVLGRGAVVIVVSDGCDRGDPGTLSAAMRFLGKRAHRVIWLNPLLGDPRYQPRTRGMVAALPFVDDFLPVHNLYSLEQLAEHLRNVPPGRTGRGIPSWTPRDPAPHAHQENA